MPEGGIVSNREKERITSKCITSRTKWCAPCRNLTHQLLLLKLNVFSPSPLYYSSFILYFFLCSSCFPYEYKTNLLFMVSWIFSYIVYIFYWLINVIQNVFSYPPSKNELKLNNSLLASPI